MSDKNTLLVVEDLTMEFKSVRRFLEKPKPGVKAVNDVSFEVKEGETFGLVGESGCGKTTLGKCIVRLLKPAKGKILYNDNGVMKDLLNLDKKESHSMRKKVQIVFQDPYAALNPQHTILEAFDEPMRVHGVGGDKEQRKELIVYAVNSVSYFFKVHFF